MKVSVLGIGTMGRAVAQRLLDRGHTVTVWNRTAGRTETLVASGAVMAETIAAAVRDAEVVLTLLTDDDAVRDVCLGRGGVGDSLEPDSVLVDMSSIHPRTSREVSAAVGEQRFMDAPILAGPATITAGTALLVVGGPDALVARLGPLLSDLSSRCVHGGAAGAGTTVKLVFNLLFLEELLALSEAVVLAQTAGLAPELVTELFSTSPLVPAGLQNRLQDVIGGDHRGWFPIPLARKDIRLAVELGREGGVQLQLASAANSVYGQAERIRAPDDDVAAVVEAVRKRATD